MSIGLSLLFGTVKSLGYKGLSEVGALIIETNYFKCLAIKNLHNIIQATSGIVEVKALLPQLVSEYRILSEVVGLIDG